MSIQNWLRNRRDKNNELQRYKILKDQYIQNLAKEFNAKNKTLLKDMHSVEKKTVSYTHLTLPTTPYV